MESQYGIKRESGEQKTGCKKPGRSSQPELAAQAVPRGITGSFGQEGTSGGL